MNRRLEKANARVADEPVADGPAAKAAPKGSLEERIARLERDAKTRESGSIRLPGGGSFQMPKFARNVDQLGQQLKLTETQKVRIKDAIDRGKQRIEEIMKVPGADGKSPYEKRQESTRKLIEAIKKRKEEGGRMTYFPTFGNYRNETIPGRNSTYGEEIDRVKKETRDEVASNPLARTEEGLRKHAHRSDARRQWRSRHGHEHVPFAVRRRRRGDDRRGRGRRRHDCGSRRRG